MTAMVERLVPGLSDVQALAVTATLVLVPPELRETLAVRINIKLRNNASVYSDGAVLAAMADVLFKFSGSTEFAVLRSGHA
jgi:hypothetical protein